MFERISTFFEVKKDLYQFLGVCLFSIRTPEEQNLRATRFLLFCWEDVQSTIFYSFSYISQDKKCISVNEQKLYKFVCPLNEIGLRDFIQSNRPLYPISPKELSELLNLKKFIEMTYEQDKKTPQNECSRFVWLYKHQ